VTHAWEDYAYREDIISRVSAVAPPRTPAWAKLPMGVTSASPAERKAQREKLKAETAAARVQAKQEAHELKRRELEGPVVELPAIVLRDGTVTHLPLEHFVSVITPFLPALCVDVENTGYQLGHVHYALRTVQLGGEPLAVVLDSDDQIQMGLASWALRAAQKLHAFSASADLVPCVNAGLISWEEAWAKMEDGVNYAKLTDPAMTGSDAEGLKELSHQLLGDYAVSKPADEARAKLFLFNKTLTKTTVLTPYERSGWANVNKRSTTMIRYAGSDVLDLAATVRVLAGKLPVAQSVLDRECRVQALTSRIAYDGFELDLPHIQEKIAEYERRQHVARVTVEVLTNGAIVNPSSPDQVLPYLLAHGYVLKPDKKTKQPSAGKASLEPYATRGDALAANVIEYRHCTTTLGLLLRQLENLCEQGDARMRPTVYTLEARTGRFSAVRPNGMQFSRQGGIRACVKAGEMNLELVDGRWEVCAN
jgi:hypothetical protein